LGLVIFLWRPFPIMRITHSPLTGQIDISPFLNAGCKIEKYYGENHLNCSSAGLKDRFKCGRILLAPQYLAGLKVPIVKCVLGTYEENYTQVMEEIEKGYIYSEGCRAPIFIRYIVFDGKDFVLLRTKEEFKNYFSPIDNPEEALSYVAAITGLYPKYGFSKAGGRYFVTIIEDSYAKEVNGNYKVHLYGYELCGCGTHPYFTTDFLVSRDGNIEELQTQKIWEDPFLMACVD
ncbi:MAG: hypothetical protein QW602_03635, partial [Candidatus Aenigmatarchaeota archaeon]